MPSRFIKKVKHRIPWVSHIVNASNAKELNHEPNVLTRVDKTNICILCRGTKNLCKKEICPVLQKAKILRPIASSSLRHIDGSSPPEIFVGRIGYPKVFVGPLLHKSKRDITSYSIPEAWRFSDIEEFLDMRLSLIRGMVRADIRKTTNRKIYDYLVETILSKRAFFAYAEFFRINKKVLVDYYVQPMGISGKIKKLEIRPSGSVRLLEKVYYDDDLGANRAMYYLYENGILVSRIIQGLSAGMFGLPFQRRLVPTRWSITAVDCIISKRLRDEIIKYNPSISEYLVFEYDGLGDKFLILMFPGSWTYEFIEIWWPGSSWNFFGKSIAIGGDYELHWGRKTYASVGGCYYATRLAVTEYLKNIKRKSGVLVIREAYSEHYMPIGVWYVRESVRRALRKKPIIFKDLDSALRYILSRIKAPINEIEKISTIIRNKRKQKKIEDFLK